MESDVCERDDGVGACAEDDRTSGWSQQRVTAHAAGQCFGAMCDGVGAAGTHPVELNSRSDPAYWTVIVPFIPIAACGVQSKSYLPAGILAKETV